MRKVSFEEVVSLSCSLPYRVLLLANPVGIENQGLRDGQILRIEMVRIENTVSLQHCTQ
jgi:hypothetical protein